ncbi:MAG: response regulator [Tepidisphaeraceae bacterium]
MDDVTEVLHAESPEETAAHEVVDLTGINILLAEDGIDNREILSAYIRGAGGTVQCVENGKEAVKAARAAQDVGNPFAIILMDMQMPVLDGYAATSQLRRRGYYEPIVALTAHAMLDDRARCISAGCDDYMSKPVDQIALLNMIKHFATSVPSQQNPNPAPKAAAEIVPVLEIPAQAAIRSPLANDPRLAPVLAAFVERLPEMATELKQHWETQSLVDLKRAAHRLAGAGGSYGLPEISKAASALEHGVEKEGFVASVNEQMNTLIGTLERVDGYRAKAA